MNILSCMTGTQLLITIFAVIIAATFIFVAGRIYERRSYGIDLVDPTYLENYEQNTRHKD